MSQATSRKEPSKTVILRREQVTQRTGLGRTTIYDYMQTRNFPKPIRLGLRMVGWLEQEIEDWLQKQIMNSRKK